jgi:putative ATP-binding cassette transporter
LLYSALELMRLVSFLLRASGATFVFALVAGAVSGACNAGLLAAINAVLAHKALGVTVFVGLVAAKLVSGFACSQLLARVSQRTLRELRCRLCRQVVDAPFRDIERAGTPRILTALTDDVSAVGAALSALPSLAVNGTVLVACSVYLAWLSPTTFALIACVIVAGICLYRGLAARAMSALRAARDEQDRLFTHFRALTEGIIELKRHAQRRAAFFERGLDATSDSLEHENLRATARFGIAHLWSQSVIYVALGAVLFGATHSRALPSPVMTGFVLTIVYLTGPLAATLLTVPMFGRAAVALDRVQALGLTAEPGATTPADCSPFRASWKAIELDRVVHAYDEGDEAFVLGPVSLRIARGEILFITGGNGSGKSTLAKIIAGLYEPQAGEIRVDGVPVTAANRVHFRELSASVLSQFFLFDTLLGFEDADADGDASRLLARLDLSHKVRVERGRLSTTDLSQGQRKRLALLTAALEQRSLYILDEWAADQDAVFKRVFYSEILPELRAAGHAAVVISHDERYFHAADRIVRLEEGALVTRIEETVHA